MYWFTRFDMLTGEYLEEIIETFDKLPEDQQAFPHGDKKCGIKKHLVDPRNNSEGGIYFCSEHGMPTFIKIEEYKTEAIESSSIFHTFSTVECKKVVDGDEYKLEDNSAFLWIGDGVFDGKCYTLARFGVTVE